MMEKALNLVLGSIAGGVSRYLLAGFVYRLFGAALPYGTLVVNLAGCFLVGFLAVLADQKMLLGPQGKLLLMVGFCGAFTTFSTFMLETSNLLRDGETLQAFLNVLLSVVLGFAALKLGMAIAEAL